jgi:hypothetical protein
LAAQAGRPGLSKNHFKIVSIFSPLTKSLYLLFTRSLGFFAMRSFTCTCGNQLFFDNSICMRCKREVGWCPTCRAIADVISTNDGAFECSCCRTRLVKCWNYASHNVCNRFVMRAEGEGTQGQTSAGIFCDCCRFNRTIPDLRIEGNREKWYRLEAAKRRTIYDLQMLGLPFGTARDGVVPSLAFEFKADLSPDRVYREMGGEQKVYTGHDNGVITLNIQEADDIARETLRVTMHEAHRSLLGHFRHEFGHYIWDVMIKGKREPESLAVFGDHNNPSYDRALRDYYAKGARSNWLLNYVSAYATMHPWEDFAETFAVYLDMSSALDTAVNGGLIEPVDPTRVDEMVDAYKKLGIAMNEMNRANGLPDYLPEMFARPIREKLRFIHGLTKYVPPTPDNCHVRAPVPSVPERASAGV